MLLNIIYGDITKLKVDAIVNAANTMLKRGSGVCGAIFEAAGVDKLQVACDNLAPIQTGEAVLTHGFELPAKYIIHTVGPVYHNGKQNEEKLLYTAYINSLKCANENNCKSVAFPLISSGSYGYPKEEALQVAKAAIGDFTTTYDIEVFLVLFETDSTEF